MGPWLAQGDNGPQRAASKEHWLMPPSEFWSEQVRWE